MQSGNKIFSIYNQCAELFFAQSDRLFLWVPVFFGGGIVCFFTRTYEPDLLLSWLVAAVLGGFAFIAMRERRNRPRLYLPSLVFMAVFFVALGFCVGALRTQIAYTPMLAKALGPVDVVGVIDSVEIQESGKGLRVVLNDLDIERLSPPNTPRKIRLVIRKAGDIGVGDRISVLAKLNPPSPPVAPRAFDFQRYAYFRGIGAVGFAFYEPEILERAKRGHFFKSIQIRMIERIERALDYPQAAFVITLMTGQKGGISDDDKNAMRDAGLAHLLAISGMHVGMVAGIVFFTARLLMAFIPSFAMRYPIKKYAAILALVAAIFYTLLVGASVTTQRALFMTGVALIAITLDRSPFSLRVVALAAIVILLFTPESLMNVSFQMSFAAVLGLISFYDATRDKWAMLNAKRGFVRKMGLYVIGVMVTTIIAEIAIAPIAIYHFQHHSVYGLVGNIVAVPLTAFVVMPLLVLSAILMPLGLEGVPLSAASYGVDGIIRIAHWTANLEGAVFNPPAFGAVALAWLLAAGTVLCLMAGRLKLLCVPLLCVGLYVVEQTPRADVYVSTKADLYAVRTQNGDLVLSSKRKDKYSRENWMRMNGTQGAAIIIFPREGQSEASFDGALGCDLIGCRAEIKGQKISFAQTQKAVIEDCDWADIVIASQPVSRKCNARRVIDRFDVWRDGATKIYISKNENSAVFQTVRDVRGDRIWDARYQKEIRRKGDNVVASSRNDSRAAYSREQ